MIDVPQKPLSNKKGIVLGIANEHSIAYGCARAFRALGAELAITYSNEKTKTYTEPLARDLSAPIFLPCDVRQPGQLEAVFQAIERAWGNLDFALHAIAFAPKEDLHGRLADSSRDGFLLAMDVSCHSFIRMARLAEPLMRNGGALFTMSYYGAEKVIEHYNLMGPVKAALESAVRYLAYEFGPKGDSRSRHLARAYKNARRVRDRSFRRSARDCRQTRARTKPRQHRGCWRGDRRPRNGLREADHRRNGLCGCRISHYWMVPERLTYIKAPSTLPIVYYDAQQTCWARRAAIKICCARTRRKPINV